VQGIHIISCSGIGFLLSSVNIQTGRALVLRNNSVLLEVGIKIDGELIHSHAATSSEYIRQATSTSWYGEMRLERERESWRGQGGLIFYKKN
jgi:hypothetical protein